MPFLSISGSEFLEMFVGVGPARVCWYLFVFIQIFILIFNRYEICSLKLARMLRVLFLLMKLMPLVEREENEPALEDMMSERTHSISCWLRWMVCGLLCV